MSSPGLTALGEVKKQECHWFPRTKWVVHSPEIPIRKKLVGQIFEFLEIHRCPEGAEIGSGQLIFEF